MPVLQTTMWPDRVAFLSPVLDQHSRATSPQNSRSLSKRMFSGTPYLLNRSAGVSITSRERRRYPTTMSRHIRLCSS